MCPSLIFLHWPRDKRWVAIVLTRHLMAQVLFCLKCEQPKMQGPALELLLDLEELSSQSLVSIGAVNRELHTAIAPYLSSCTYRHEGTVCGRRVATKWRAAPDPECRCDHHDDPTVFENYISACGALRCKNSEACIAALKADPSLVWTKCPVFVAGPETVAIKRVADVIGNIRGVGCRVTISSAAHSGMHTSATTIVLCCAPYTPFYWAFEDITAPGAGVAYDEYYTRGSLKRDLIARLPFATRSHHYTQGIAAWRNVSLDQTPATPVVYPQCRKH